MLELDDLRVTLPGGRDLARLTLRVTAGEVVTLMAPSGAGKSSVLGAIAGTGTLAATGRIALNGRDLTDAPPETRRIGVMFQDPLLFAHLDVAGNLGFGLRRREERAARIEAALHAAGLAGMGARDPATLSGGEAARVALMRTLLSDPEALLLDEPFSRLDAALRASLRAWVFAQARALPVIMVTHDRTDALAAGGRVIDLWGEPV
jgi:putative thiamine transport system ATP-binding protein